MMGMCLLCGCAYTRYLYATDPLPLCEFNFKQLVGRFRNAAGRNFVLVRRNLSICLGDLIETVPSKSARRMIRFKRNLGFLLRSARHLDWRVAYGWDKTYGAFSHEHDERTMTRAVDVVDSLCGMQRVKLGQLRSVSCYWSDDGDTAKHCHAYTPNSLRPLVRRLKTDHLLEASDAACYANLPNVRHIVLCNS